jgi:NAD(P)-dependent dehydrogenase (short-subunit alcohol dehydrogenase family)
VSDILSSKVVIVTGASSGLGRATAIAAGRHGAAAVIVGDITDQPNDSDRTTEAELAAMGVAAQFVPVDVTRRADVDILVASSEAYGGVDVMVANAGITLDVDNALVSEPEFERLMNVNVKGVLFSAQAAATQMKSRGKPGSIVLMGSMGGIAGSGMTVAYSTSKGGVVMLAKALCDALGPDGIRVNAVCPGMIDTRLLRETPGVAAAVEGFLPRTPLRRVGQPSEIGDVIAWLGSNLSSYVTGISLLVDGGLLSVI